MQPVRAVVRKFILPVACFAGSAWAFAFCVAYAAMPKRDIGVAILFAFAGIVMAAPWIIMALGVLQRMHDAAKTQRERDDSGDNAR